jgi:hypothetical protein
MQVAEFGVDVLYVSKIVLVCCGVRGILTLPGDLFFYLMQKPSFHIARQVIDHHLSLLFADLLRILSLVMAWDTLRFAVATAVFGVFSPCVILEGAFGVWNASDAPHHNDWNLCVAAFLLILSSIWVIGVPVFVGYYVASHNASDAPAAVFLTIMCVVLYAGLGVALARCDKPMIATGRSTIKALRFSLRHAGVAFAMLLEMAQLLALVFSVSDASLFGETIGSGLQQASLYIYAIFGQSWTRLALPFGVYLALVLAIIYFIVSGAPVVCGGMLHWRKGAELVKSPAWIAAMEFFGQTVMLTVVRNISLLLVCDESSNRLWYARDVTIVNAPQCWDGALKHVTVFAMILLTYYVPTSLMRNQKLNVAVVRGVDVVAPQLLRLMTQLPIATCCVLCTLLVNHRIAILSIVTVTMLWCLICTAMYERWFRESRCSVQTIGVYHMVKYAIVLACAIALLAHQASGQTRPTYASLYASMASIAVGIIVSAAIGVGLSRSTRQSKRIPLKMSSEDSWLRTTSSTVCVHCETRRSPGGVVWTRALAQVRSQHSFCC